MSIGLTLFVDGSKMDLFFKCDMFNGQLLRVLGHTYYNGADVGEVFACASQIKDADTGSWLRNWQIVAHNQQKMAEDFQNTNQKLSAYQSWLKASTYYRIAYIFHLDIASLPLITAMYKCQAECFAKAMEYSSHNVQKVNIPYQNTYLSGYWFTVDDTPRKTLIINGGYDSTKEESYYYGVVAALDRGYNCLIFDGPGQGNALFEQQLYFRHDWEEVIKHVVDYVITLPSVIKDKIVLMGLSFGGYLVGRAAAFEKRLAACIVDPGQISIYDMINKKIPAELLKMIEQNDPTANEVLGQIKQDPIKGWALRRGMLTHGASSPLDYIQEIQKYSLRDYIKQISCPILISSAENDILAHQSYDLYIQITGQKELINFKVQDGAGEHCESSARSFFHQKMFQWLSIVLDK